MTTTFVMSFSDAIPGGPCPVCGAYALLLMHTGTFDPEGERRIVHSQHNMDFQVCRVAMSHGWLLTFPDGTWTYTQGDLHG